MIFLSPFPWVRIEGSEHVSSGSPVIQAELYEVTMPLPPAKTINLGSNSSFSEPLRTPTAFGPSLGNQSGPPDHPGPTSP
jgi:hypothetical protein